jgi:hypothetical protein
MNADQMKTGQGRWLALAAVLYFLSLSWPVHLPTLQYVIREGVLPIRHVFGQPIRALGGGFIEVWGSESTIASILAFGVSSALEILAGYWLWKRQKRGGMLALGLLPIYWFFAVGWMVPYMWLIGALQAISLALGWKSLSGDSA